MLKKLLKHDYYRTIPEDDYMARQRYILFVLFSLIAVGTGIIVFVLLHYVYRMPGRLAYMMPIFSLIAVLNYLIFQFHKKTTFSYSFIIGTALFLIHTFIYFTGGIYAPANLYLIVLAVTCFMLIGKRAGWLYFGLSIVHLGWAFYATRYTHLISNYHSGKPGNMEADLMMSGIICVGIISLHCMSLAKSTQVILHAMSQTNQSLVNSLEAIEKTNTQLEKTNKELDKFAYVVSHDLKAPLRAIGSLSSWIEEDMQGQLSPSAADNISLLKGRVLRMENLINGILEYSRLNKDKHAPEDIALNELIMECIETVQPPENFDIYVQENMPVLTLSRLKFQQIFTNLISNSIKHNDKERGLVKIGFRETRHNWEFNVQDNGPGIDEEYHEKVFVIFQTLQARDKFESTGVGLAIVKKVVDENGGQIHIESKAGEGSNFIFTWPKPVPSVMSMEQMPMRMAG